MQAVRRALDPAASRYSAFHPAKTASARMVATTDTVKAEFADAINI